MQVCRNQCTVHTSVCFLRWREIGELTQHKSKKEWSFKEESIDCYICARAFILKTSREYKSKVLRSVCCCQRMVAGTLTPLPDKPSKSGSHFILFLGGTPSNLYFTNHG